MTNGLSLKNKTHNKYKDSTVNRQLVKTEKIYLITLVKSLLNITSYMIHILIPSKKGISEYLRVHQNIPGYVRSERSCAFFLLKISRCQYIVYKYKYKYKHKCKPFHKIANGNNRNLLFHKTLTLTLTTLHSFPML